MSDADQTQKSGAPTPGPEPQVTKADSTEPPAPSMADRLGDVCIELRADLEVSRHVFRGEPHYVLRDPVSFGSHSFRLADYRILTALRSEGTLSETFDELVARGDLREVDEERFYEFIFSLHKLGFLHLPISDEKGLYRRYESRRGGKRGQLLKSVLFFRIPLFDPDEFLERTLPPLRSLFTRTAFLVWLGIVGLAGLVVARHWGEFTAPVGDLFSRGNLPLLWITLITLKVFHEFGHAYATKAFGGRVPEMGLYLMIFTPCAYVDASAAWGFPSKRHRIFVCFAGMYVELFIAALCVMAWSVLPPGFWRSILHNAVLLASVVTIAFNVNPLMRYDGYYALSDALEIPNLRQRAAEQGTALLKRVFLGVKHTGRQLGFGLRAFLIAFGVAGGLYKIVLVLGISATVAMQFPKVGIAMAVAYLASEVIGTLRRLLPYLWHAEETSHVRGWATALSLVLIAGVPAALFGVPLPATVTTRAVLSGADEVALRASAPGFVEAISAEEGSILAEGQAVVQLTDPDAEARLAELVARLEAERFVLERARGVDLGEVAKETELVAQLEHEIAVRTAELQELSISAPIEGHLTSRLRADEIGRYVRAGESLGTVVGGATVVRALLSEEELAATRPEPGTRVEFRSHALPGRLVVGYVTRLAPAGRHEFDHTFAGFLDPADYAVQPGTGRATRSQFEIEVRLDEPVEARTLQGLTGKLRLEGVSEPIGQRLVRKVRTFLRSLSG